MRRTWKQRTVLAPLLGLLLGLQAAPTRPETLTDVAAAYLAAIEAQDWERMAELLAPEAHYQDYSMEHFGRSAIDLRGPEAIVGFWRESSADAGTLSIDFEFPERFVAGANLVLGGHSMVEVRGEAWQLPLEVIAIEVPQITHLRVADGRVTYHADHVDYHSAEEQIVAQVEAHNQQHGTEAEFPLTAIDPALLETAEAYLKALHGNRWQQVAERLGPESEYLNYTAEALIGSVERAHGGEAIVQMFRHARASSGTLALDFDRELAWVAGPNVFLYGLYNVETSGEAWGLDESTVSFEVPMVIHLRFIEGVLTHHVEYLDYATGFGPLGSP